MRGPESPATPRRKRGFFLFSCCLVATACPGQFCHFLDGWFRGAQPTEDYWNLRLDLGWALASESAPFPLGVFHPALRMPSDFRISV